MPAMEKSRSNSFLEQQQQQQERDEERDPIQRDVVKTLPQQQQQQEDDGGYLLEDVISLSTSSSNPSPDNPFYANVPQNKNGLKSGNNDGVSISDLPVNSLVGNHPATQALTNNDLQERVRGPLGDAKHQSSSSSTGAAADDAWAMMDLGSDSSDNEDPIHNSLPTLPQCSSTTDLLPRDVRMLSDEPLSHSQSAPTLSLQEQQEHLQQQAAEHRYHLLCQIQEDREASTLDDTIVDNEQTESSNMDEPKSPFGSPLRRSGPPPLSQPYIHPHDTETYKNNYFVPQYTCTKIAHAISKRVFDHEDFAVATWLGFWALLNVTCANYVLSPMRDAVALHVGVQHIPKLTLASSLLAFLSSVPIGWLFEAPDPSRRKVWKKMGLTRGETQGTSLALFYRFFAVCVLAYAVGFQLVDWMQTRKGGMEGIFGSNNRTDAVEETEEQDVTAVRALAIALWRSIPFWLTGVGQFTYIAFFLVMHLMKLHSISLVWGVTTEAMEYEDVARKQLETRRKNGSSINLCSLSAPPKTKTRLQRLALVGFGGTLGGVWGSILASSLAKVLHLPGLLVVSAYLLEVSAELSIELGRIMQKHWEDQQIFQSTTDLTSLDPSMKRSASAGSMKRISSGNSLYAAHQQSMKRVASGNSLNSSRAPMSPSKSLTELSSHQHTDDSTTKMAKGKTVNVTPEASTEDTFSQRLLRGITTILKSRLLMAIFTYNALFASTSVLLSFQRAELVANRNSSTTVSADTAFLANINMASSIAVFAFQASGIGAFIAQKCGPRGSLALMPAIRLTGLLCLCWWHRFSNGQAPNLILFLMLDECTRVVNLAIAKPVRESLWRGLSNEARYEAKPIVDTLANRWGAGSASFCVSVVNRVLLFMGQRSNTNAQGEPIVLGLPPVLFLGLIVAAWWVGVSFDLGHIRKRIDAELKKHQ
ncbi:major facilitator superfamily transporter [Nitzschia inconspicua]|uniref:Major facilitator superfamily transporter n=1 Tax=Nitzschia inconspicua TaxID=303405 RepID=A0A9K3PDM9_9STRA|nr:major facilitator superfamily transporter [Nitzschia inconspicua]